MCTAVEGIISSSTSTPDSISTSLRASRMPRFFTLPLAIAISACWLVEGSLPASTTLRRRRKPVRTDVAGTVEPLGLTSFLFMAGAACCLAFTLDRMWARPRRRRDRSEWPVAATVGTSPLPKLMLSCCSSSASTSESEFCLCSRSRGSSSLMDVFTVRHSVSESGSLLQPVDGGSATIIGMAAVGGSFEDLISSMVCVTLPLISRQVPPLELLSPAATAPPTELPPPPAALAVDNVDMILGPLDVGDTPSMLPDLKF